MFRVSGSIHTRLKLEEGKKGLGYKPETGTGRYVAWG
jgi:hypothetical protein